MTPTSAGAPSELEIVRAALAEHYDILEQIGRGGMAIVYRARERDLEREVAVKVLPPQLAFDESFVDRFQREGRIAAQLEHPHIVPIYRVGRSGQVIYIVMKLLRGESLAERLASRGALPAGEVRRILAETASALGYAAKRGVVHRDVKPHNIMLDDEDRCVVTDFGIARSRADSKLTATGMSVGTPRYMSPEQARAKPLDGRSDLYSLGIVGYECLVGTTPFGGEDALAVLMEHVKSPVPRPALRNEEEVALFAVIERLLAKDPDDRFQSGEEVVAALGQFPLAPRPSGPHARRPSSLSPTQPARALEAGADLAVREASGPEPSMALDRALQAGVDLLREHAPKLRAGLRTFAWRAPGSSAATNAGNSIPTASQRAEPRWARLRAAAARAAEVAERARSYVVARGARFWVGGVAATVLVFSSYYAVHFATKHRSRCPLVDHKAPAVVLQGEATDGEPSSEPPVRRPAFSLMVDAVGTQRGASRLDVYYDVCGLDAGAAFTTSVSVTKTESGLKRLLGTAVEPVRATYDETARGPRVRRHRTLDFANMPAGSYRLVVVVADESGRRRSKATEFRVLEP